MAYNYAKEKRKFDAEWKGSVKSFSQIGLQTLW